MCSIAEENFIRIIAVHRLVFKHTFYISTTFVSVVALAGLYMDVGIDLNAIYAIMCRKTVIIPENDEESTHSGLRERYKLESQAYEK